MMISTSLRLCLAGLLALAITSAADARGHGGSHSSGGGSHSSSGSRVSYGGGHHTESHGGSYAGGQGSSHRGGSYRNVRTGDRYGTHR